MLVTAFRSEDFSQIFTCVTGPLEEHKRLLWLTESLVRRGIGLDILRDAGLGAALYELSTTESESSIAARAAQQLSSLPTENSVVSALRQRICTLAYTGDVPVAQLLYGCESCSLREGLVACGVCVLECHRGHLITERVFGVGYCDCKATCKDKCVASQGKSP